MPEGLLQVQVKFVVEDPQHDRDARAQAARREADLDVGQVVVETGDDAPGPGDAGVAQHLAATGVAVDHRHAEGQGGFEELAVPVPLDGHHLVASFEQLANDTVRDAAKAAYYHVVAVGARQGYLPALATTAFVEHKAPEVENTLKQQGQAEQRRDKKQYVAEHIAVGDGKIGLKRHHAHGLVERGEDGKRTHPCGDVVVDEEKIGDVGAGQDGEAIRVTRASRAST